MSEPQHDHAGFGDAVIDVVEALAAGLQIGLVHPGEVAQFVAGEQVQSAFEFRHGVSVDPGEEDRAQGDAAGVEFAGGVLRADVDDDAGVFDAGGGYASGEGAVHGVEDRVVIPLVRGGG
ncbi:MAG: hypothetical protein GKR94_04365 [Gammaproteobacteria bacterium]|nr:hypothetical protein [Gammaproteobacteria bacterium]